MRTVASTSSKVTLSSSYAPADNFPFVEPLIGWFYFKSPGGKERMKLTETVEGLVNAKEKSGESGKDGEVSAIRLCITSCSFNNNYCNSCSSKTFFR